MPNFIYSLSDVEAFFVLIAFTITVSIIFVAINKLFIYRKLRYRDNSTISSISSLIGIIYGILIGFLCLYLMTNQDHASQAVQNEANALGDIYRQSLRMQQPLKDNLQKNLHKYINVVTQEEWPAMNEAKKVGLHGDFIILDLVNDLKDFEPRKNSEIAINENLTQSIQDLYNARHERINMSYLVLPPEIWEVVLLGTILIMGINYAFRVNFYLHIFGTFTFAIMAASMLFLLVTLDTPFQGEFDVSPQPLKEVLSLMDAKRAP